VPHDTEAAKSKCLVDLEQLISLLGFVLIR
jgi:hypothetical protein